MSESASDITTFESEANEHGLEPQGINARENIDPPKTTRASFLPSAASAAREGEGSAVLWGLGFRHVAKR